MPVYAYRCSSCGVQFEKQQTFSDQSLLRCPECGKRALKKVYLPVGIVFKGSGFYATDHHSPSGQLSKKADEKLEEKKDSKESGESKEPAAKTEKSSEKSTDKSSEKSSEKSSDERSEKKE
ncbi:MAG: zinc ribbon domain-containing protein [Anaerolineales bacterium]